MNTSEIQLRYSPRPLRPAAAWFILGSRAAEWLDEICIWGVPLGNLTLYLVPQSAVDRSPAGVLVTVRGKDSPTVSPWAIPYGCVASRLYLPVEAWLFPPVEDQELAALVGTGLAAAVWHPVCGLVGFEPVDGLTVAGLLSWPGPRGGDWDRARPGMAFNTRLRSVEPDRLLTCEMIMQDGRGDIGTEAQELPRQPDAPGESSFSSLREMGARALSAAAQAAQRLLRGASPATPPQNTSQQNAASQNAPALQAPGSGGQPGTGWGARLANWLGQMAQSAAQRADYESERARALRRLLHMLNNDPDQGLKFALPLGGDAFRGRAPPSGQLTERNVNFDLSRLGGGEAADFWNVPQQMQFELIRQYRRLAERELHLGRHRRAAYIFAELLNDLAAAAAALISGKHYREAAVLYRDRLKQPREAAKCLEQGGLWAEALQSYEELQEYEHAGDLARKLEQHDDAERLHRLAVDRILSRKDFPAAARLLENKLHVPDEALEVLLKGWWSVPAQRVCIRETFRLLGRLGRHDAAREQLSRCTAAPVALSLPEEAQTLPDDATVEIPTLASIRSKGWPAPRLGNAAVIELAEVAQTYPDDGLRLAAADTVRVFAAARLPNVLKEERRVMLDAVAGLVPEDRLLARDCRRYLEHGSRPAPRPPQTARTTVPEAELVRKIRLPPHVEWKTMRATDSHYYAAGTVDRNLIVMQGQWNRVDLTYRTFWCLDQTVTQRQILLEPDPQEIQPLYVHFPGGPVLGLQHLRPGNDEYRETTACSPPWATPETRALSRAPHGVTWTVSRSAGGLALAAYNSRQRPLASRLIEISDELAAILDDLPVFLQFRDQRSYIGLWNRLIVAHERGDNEVVELPGLIFGMACSMPFSRRRLAVACESGGIFFWDDDFSERETFAVGSSNPIVEFTATGMLLAAREQKCQLYSTNDHQLRLKAECHWGDGTPLSVMRTGVQNEFAISFAEGFVYVYRMP
jgi:hypothetical protein